MAAWNEGSSKVGYCPAMKLNTVVSVAPGEDVFARGLSRSADQCEPSSVFDLGASETRSARGVHSAHPNMTGTWTKCPFRKASTGRSRMNEPSAMGPIG
jgi:hypothetical protein